jgi:glycosyltransferase involved in cell wall biosynthesis
MNIFINALSARQGGGQTYLRYLLESAVEVKNASIYIVAPDSFELPGNAANVQRLAVSWPVTNPLTRWVWERFRLPGILRRLKANVLFCPGGLINTVPPVGCKTVTMFRNMVPFDIQQRRRYPLGYSRVRNWLLERSMLSSMLGADFVIFISEFAKKVIERRSGGELANSAVIPHGIGADFQIQRAKVEPERPKWLPEGDYFLYVSTFDFYKAQIEVVRGFALLKEMRHTPEHLVLVGAENPAYGRRLRQEIVSLGLEQSVVLVDFVPRRELPGAYRHALVNIFASECENCPNILLEAMAMGRPVVASNRQPMPEFGGDAVVYFNPSSPREMASAILDFVDDDNARTRLSRTARERSALYEWTKAARETWREIGALAQVQPASESGSVDTTPRRGTAGRALFLFPLAFMVNAASMTVLLIVIGLLGKSQMAADIGIVQGATLALFYAFSANARSVILNARSGVSVATILRARMLLLVPLGALAILASVYWTDVEFGLALALVLRRCSEWLSEVHLSELERKRDSSFASKFVGVQILLLVFAVAGLLSESRFAYSGLYCWALLPVFLSMGFVKSNIKSPQSTALPWAPMLPHFGSTAVIGIAVYVFRLLILLLVGREYAGDLYTAFALGGILGSVFAQALGPSLVHYADSDEKVVFPAWLNVLLTCSVMLGVVLIGMSSTGSAMLESLGKSNLFWAATGASLVGGAIMVFAQSVRIRLLQRVANQDIFGPDVMINIIIIACVPYGYYLLGSDALIWLFLLNSTLAVLFYASADRISSTGLGVFGVSSRMMGGAIVFVLIAPIFFQLKGSLFREASPMWTAEGLLLYLPIPFSVFACYGGILLSGRYERAHRSLWTIFSCFCLMLLATMITTHGQRGVEESKLILLIQFILPMFALVLGQMFESKRVRDHYWERMFFAVASSVVVFQLMAGWVQGVPFLTPYLFVFSIYQYLQYVPVILASAYLLGVFTLWDSGIFRRLCLAASIPMGIYAAASGSMLTMGMLLLGIGAFVFYSLMRHGVREKGLSVFLAIALIGSMSGYFTIVQKTGFYYGKFDAQNAESTTASGRNVSDRIAIWKHYVAGTLSDSERFLFGHRRLPDRAEYPSAHNYYLDFVYSFGVVALLPIVLLLVFTIMKSIEYRRNILAAPDTVGLAFVVFFLILVDNSLKVGMRQPYPGIITFFLWGVFLSRLSEMRPQWKVSSEP